MRIVINALSARTGGGVTYLNRLLFYLGRVDVQNEYHVLVTPENREKIISGDPSPIHVVEVYNRNSLHRAIYEQQILPGVLDRLCADVVYAPAEVAPLMARCPVVLAIQNPNPYYNVGIKWTISQRLRLTALKAMAYLSARKAARIIFVSDTSRKHIANLLGIDHSKTRVIYHGVELEHFGDPALPQMGKAYYSITGGADYILTVSSFDFHKNLPTLIRAYSDLEPCLRERYKLLIVGSGDTSDETHLRNISSDLGLDGQVIFAGEVAHEQLAAIYAGAAMFVLPSYLETFGMPLIEAMASGLPVVAAQVSAIPEILGGAGLLFDPTNPEELGARMVQVLTDSHCREDLVCKGKLRAAEFSWEATAQRTLQVFWEACAT